MLFGPDRPWFCAAEVLEALAAPEALTPLVFIQHRELDAARPLRGDPFGEPRQKGRGHTAAARDWVDKHKANPPAAGFRPASIAFDETDNALLAINQSEHELVRRSASRRRCGKLGERGVRQKAAPFSRIE